MQPDGGLPGLVISPRGPVRAACLVLARRHPAGPGRYAMQDRPVERRVDDLVVGHEPLLFNTPNLSQTDVHVTFDREPILNGTAQ